MSWCPAASFAACRLTLQGFLGFCGKCSKGILYAGYDLLKTGMYIWGLLGGGKGFF